MSEALSSRCWATGCKAFSPTPGSSSAREASTPGCAYLPVEQRRRFAMRGHWLGSNRRAGPRAEPKAVQRRHARFVNTTMMGHRSGSGRIGWSCRRPGSEPVSAASTTSSRWTPQARSILCLRSTRRAQGSSAAQASSGATVTSTIPRHLRDIVVTWYGIADLPRTAPIASIASALVEVMGRRLPGVLRRRRDGGPENCRAIPDPGGGARAIAATRMEARFGFSRVRRASP